VNTTNIKHFFFKHSAVKLHLHSHVKTIDFSYHIRFCRLVSTFLFDAVRSTTLLYPKETDQSVAISDFLCAVSGAKAKWLPLAVYLINFA